MSEAREQVERLCQAFPQYAPPLRQLLDENAKLPKACPCKHTTPCREDCPCTGCPSSCLCQRCCTYGSPQQQKAMAEYLAGLQKEHDAARTLLDVVCDAPLKVEILTSRVEQAEAKVAELEAALAAERNAKEESARQLELSEAWRRQVLDARESRDAEWRDVLGERLAECQRLRAELEQAQADAARLRAAREQAARDCDWWKHVAEHQREQIDAYADELALLREVAVDLKNYLEENDETYSCRDGVRTENPRYAKVRAALAKVAAKETT